MKIRAIGEHIVIRPMTQEEVTKGGIVIPEVLRLRTEKAVVIAVGPGYRCKDGSTYPLDVKEGDVILYGKGSGTDVEVDGQVITIIKEENVISIFQTKEAVC